MAILAAPKSRAYVIMYPLSCCDPLFNSLATPFIFWCLFLFLYPERVVRLVCKDIIIAQSQGGALFCHEFVAKIDPDDILYLIY